MKTVRINVNTYGESKLKKFLTLAAVVIATLAIATSTASADNLEGSSGLGDGERPWGIEQVQPAYEAVDAGVDVTRVDTGEVVDYYIFEAEFAPIGRFTNITVTGTSMEPFIDADKDLLLVIWHPLDVGEPVGKGDIIGFAQEDSLYGDCRATHRVITVYGDVGFGTRGDNTYISDRCIVQQRNVIYKVVGVIEDYYND